MKEEKLIKNWLFKPEILIEFDCQPHKDKSATKTEVWFPSMDDGPAESTGLWSWCE